MTRCAVLGLDTRCFRRWDKVSAYIHVRSETYEAPKGHPLYLYERLVCVAMFDMHIVVDAGGIRDYGKTSNQITLVNEIYYFVTHLFDINKTPTHNFWNSVYFGGNVYCDTANSLLVNRALPHCEC